MFFTHGVVRFHITADRKRIVFVYVLGPLYGRGRVFRVEGQGRTGCLEPDPDAKAWSS